MASSSSQLYDRGIPPPLIFTQHNPPLTPPNDLSHTTDYPLTPDPLTPNPLEIDELKLQECWDQSITKYMGLPDGYSDVHVLIIKWDDAIDDLKVRSEVNSRSLLA